jgi:negative regulator of flagellin synthesis FlgM
LSYTSGITNVQQGFDTIDVAASVNTNRAAKATQNAAVAVSGTSQAAGSSSASAVDQTSLSQASGLMAQALSGSDDVRTEKVAALQQSIAAGTYNVSSSAVADKLISSLLQ